MPRGASPCGARRRKRSVSAVRCAASPRVTQPRSAPTVYAVSPNPTAAIEENDFVGARSGVSRVPASARSQNHWNVSRSSLSRKASVSGDAVGTGAAVVLRVSAAGGAGRQRAKRTREQAVSARSAAGRRKRRDGWPSALPVPATAMHPTIERQTIPSESHLETELETPRLRDQAVRGPEVLVRRIVHRRDESGEAAVVIVIGDVERAGAHADAVVPREIEVLLQRQVPLLEREARVE